MSFTWRAAFAAVALAVYSTICVTPRAFANSQAVPCSELDQVHESLDDDIGAGTAGVREQLGTPSVIGGLQKFLTDQKLAMVDHGLHYMNEIDIDHPVPGLEPLLDKLRDSTTVMKDAVVAAFPVTWDWVSTYDSSQLERVVHPAQPQPSTWQTIDDADQKKNDIYGLVNNLHGHCSP